MTTCSSGFFTDEHGRAFYDMVDYLESGYLQPYRMIGHPVSTIDHCLVLMDNADDTVTVYINELEIITKVITKTDITVGEIISKEHIGGVLSLSFNNATIPDTNGVIFYFHVDWKRGIFFDFRPNASPLNKLENVSRRLAELYEMLLFYEIYSVSEGTWDKANAEGWFPFIALLDNRELKGLIDRLDEGKPIEKREALILDSIDQESLDKLATKFSQLPFLEPHSAILSAGIERYLAGDYISAINNIWPRIEGILRYVYHGKDKPTQGKLVDNIRELVANKSISPYIFFPDRFRNYLLNFYFRAFDLATKQLNVSRHSIGHGVSSSETYTRKYALLGILIVDQLSYYVSSAKREH